MTVTCYPLPSVPACCQITLLISRGHERLDENALKAKEGELLYFMFLHALALFNIISGYTSINIILK